jgi:murein DD-endopeptidase MepM/ murein hydrolase activator NlpD
VKGKVISGFGMRQAVMHQGLDIKAPQGTLIRAVAEGKVRFCSEGLGGYGKVIIIEHSRSLVTVYAHNRENLVREGQNVRQGEVIAQVGQSGRAQTPHLHFEVREGGRAQDPLLYLPEGED